MLLYLAVKGYLVEIAMVEHGIASIPAYKDSSLSPWKAEKVTSQMISMMP